MNRFNGLHYRRQQGFTYLWVIFLVALLELGLASIVENSITRMQRDKEAQLLSIGHQFRLAIARYYTIVRVNGQHEYPETLADLLKDERFPGIKRHLRQIFIDPMTGKAEWGTIKMNGRIVGIYSLSDRHPLKQDGFDVEDLSLQNKSKYSEWIFTYPSDLLVETSNNINPPLKPVSHQEMPEKGEPKQ